MTPLPFFIIKNVFFWFWKVIVLIDARMSLGLEYECEKHFIWKKRKIVSITSSNRKRNKKRPVEYVCETKRVSVNDKHFIIERFFNVPKLASSQVTTAEDIVN